MSVFVRVCVCVEVIFRIWRGFGGWLTTLIQATKRGYANSCWLAGARDE